MAEPRFQRRKEDRPAEITQAALAAFAENGYAATRVDEVAKRAGVSKGLLYLYFKTKEDLFKAVIRSFLSPRIDALISNIEETELSAEEFVRGPFLEFATSLPKSPAKILVRLMIAEGPKHPDLIAWYWDNVVSRALDALRTLIKRGVDNGEFRKSALDEFPQLLITPIFFSMVWTLLFQPHTDLDTDRFIEAHVEMVLDSVKAKCQ
ncbi:MAG: TetR/AcrR family transcriptional regulator [Proteobacteria bacterium]|nr:TetR/AcrR family transcriptional regulator [Pseudomonadota bacterium]